MSYAATIDWGDGNGPQASPVTIDTAGSAGAATQGHTDLSNTYYSAGTYTATLNLYEFDSSGNPGADPIATQSFAVTVVAPPAAPAALSGQSASASEIDLAWGDVAGATGYTVQISTDGVNWSNVGGSSWDDGSTYHYYIGNLSPNTGYAFRASAR